jgi:protein TonB
MISKMTEAVETKIIEDVKPPPPPDTPPPPPPPEMKAPPPPFIPPVEVQVQQPQQQNVIANATTVKPATTDIHPQPAAAPAPAKPAYNGPAHTAAVVDMNTCARPEYPKSSLRNEETGTTTILFQIGVDGSVKGAAIQKSSGFRDLDRAAISALSKCRFKPGTENGQPVETSSPVQYVWTLE